MRTSPEIVTLNNGVRIVNFCSVNRFLFDEHDDKGVQRFLPSCPTSRVTELFPDLALELVGNDTLVQSGFTPDKRGMVTFDRVPQPNSHLRSALASLQKRSDVDVILVKKPLARILELFELYNGKLRMPFDIDVDRHLISGKWFLRRTPFSSDALYHSGEPFKRSGPKWTTQAAKLVAK